MIRKMLLIVLAASLSLAACHDDDDEARTVTKLVASEIENATDATSTPIALNDLPISNSGTDETSLPVAIN